MKVPVSILCISDLHFKNKELEPVKQLGIDLLAYIHNNENVTQLRWIPDYIVIAGDITNQGNKNYKEPKKHIEGLLKVFKLGGERVIMVPGNHDKDTKKDDLKTYKDECELFDKYQKMESKEVITEFRNHFVSKFNNYLSFAQSFLSDSGNGDCGCNLYKNPKLLISKSVEDCRVKLLSGIRYYKEDSLCFFLVNTEWLYIPPKNLMKEKLKLGSMSISNEYFYEKEEYLTIKEKCKLCVPLINDAFNLIKEKHPECTVVTVMHRDFKDLTWIENNHTDLSQKDPICQIEAVSDLILTGHEHSVKIESPTFVKNNVQHFKIGSTGRDSYGVEEPIRTACIININPAKECVEMLNAQYNSITNSWHFEENNNTFPLRQKYCQIGTNHTEMIDDNVVIKAKSIDKEIIEAEIVSYFNITDSSVGLYPIRYNPETLKDDLEKIFNSEKCKTIFIVVYRVISDIKTANHVEKEIIRDFKECHQMDFLCNKIIIKEINILVPNLLFE